MSVASGLDVPVDDVTATFAGVVADAFASREGERFSLVLSGGETARACYEQLAASRGPAGSGIDWSLVSVFLGDERLVPADDPDANQRMVRESLIERVAPVAAFRPMPTDGPAAACAAAYERTIAELLETDGIDLIHLGMGPDGHTASLFAGSAALESDQLVAANVDPSGRNPHPRLTLTLKAIDRARLAVFTVAGEAKREAVRSLRTSTSGSPSTSGATSGSGSIIPAARVRAGAMRWLIDAAAFGPGGHDQEVPSR